MWQTIDTAPKDGSVVDLWCATERVADASWSYPELDGEWSCKEWCILRNNFLQPVMFEPTHWMPIPEPPK